jgi:hypothetical protein
MRALLLRVVPALALVALALAVANGSDGTAAALGAAVIVAAIAAAALGIALLARPRVAVIGGRVGRDHGLVAADPAPRHPDTAGRPRPRAPGRGLPAA